MSDLPHPRHRPWTDGALAALLQWRHSLFWTIAPAMFLTSCLTWLTLDSIATMSEDGRLRDALAPARLQPALRQALQTSAPLLTTLPQALCTDMLELLAERVLATPMADRTGDINSNGFVRAAQEGRLAVSLRAQDGGGCRFGPGPLNNPLQQQISAAANGIVELPDGWLSVTTVAAPNGMTLTAGVHILSPWAKITRPRLFGISLASFILCISLVVALVLLMLLIRRIERANRAADAWTHGHLEKRINDQGKDELSRLTQKFDLMADATVGLIKVKQALAAAEERNRLARDLHDTAKQRAFALNLQLTALREMHQGDASSARLADAALSLTYQLQQDLTGIVRRLAAPTIAESGFRTVLTEGVEALLAGSRITPSITLSSEFEAALSAAPEVSQQLFMIAMEAVANVLKHAQACTNCRLEGMQDGDLYTWRIADNGAGLANASSVTKGMGIANMKLRAASLPDGDFALLNGDDGGAVILVTFRMML
ncbi:HAMP domain-containing protein [Duganella sp. FT80W]|uniref:histidine kinase n=1 Tax=Duganella guangzhouensis TaxID=2666084 RepID=A0A6I2L8V7_9BURK|nr:histidine kinase [Duganella guangzhouensis]MRW93264.1 HAMP domain-containing protein [Duganella guangzhouensis]